MPEVMDRISNSNVSTWELPEGAIARFGRGKITDIAFSLDGESLVVATDIGLWLYDLAAPRAVALWDTERGMVSAISLSYDGQQLAAGNADGVVKVWDIQARQLLLEVGERTLNDSISRIVFSPDGQYLAASRHHNFTVSVWYARTEGSVTEFTVETPKALHGQSRPLCFSPDSQFLAYMSDDRTITVTRLENEVPPLHFTIDAGCVDHLVFTPCGQFLAAGIRKSVSGDDRSTVHVWNVHDRIPEVRSFEYSGYFVIPTYSARGTLQVADIHEDEVIIWNTHPQEKLDTFKHQGATRAARFSADGQHFAIASGRDFHVWRASMPHVISLPRHSATSDSVIFFQNGKALVSGHGEGSGIVFWNVLQKIAQQTLPATVELNDAGRTISMSPDEKFLATGFLKMIEIWDIISGIRLQEFAENQSISAVAFSPTSKHFVSATQEGELYVWDTQRWEKKYSFNGQHTSRVLSIVFRPDGKQLLSVSADKTVRVWDFETLDLIALLPLLSSLDAAIYKGDVEDIKKRLHAAQKTGQAPQSRQIMCIIFSPSGDIIAGGLSGEIRFWDATTYETRMVILLPKGCQRPFALAFSPCGRYLASGSWWYGGDKVSIRLWDVSIGENIATFWGHPTDVQDIAFSPDGMRLASGGFDGTILLWDLKDVIGS